MFDHAGRRDRAREAVRREQVEAILISSPTNVSYLTGFTGESSPLILTATKTLLVSDERFREQLAEECPDLEVVFRPPSRLLPQAVAAALHSLGAASVGFESASVTVAELETLRDLAKAVAFKPTRDLVESLRAIKDEEEVLRIREAIGFAERAWMMFRAMLRSEDDEKSSSDAMEAYLRRAGARCSSFPTIVASGERSALAHAPPTSRRFGDAGVLLVDWGASGTFYKSDLTRVLVDRKNFPTSRPATKGLSFAELEGIFDIVAKAQAAAIAAIRPGVKACDVDRAARQVIENAGYGDRFGHALGHGIGMQVHESPMLRQNVETPLRAGMVVTVEPGIYLPGKGGVRIEDDVLVTPDGCEVLSRLPRDWEWAQASG